MKKLIAAILIVIVALLIWGAKSRPEPLMWRNYIVDRGDTLWDIAEEITPESIAYRTTIKYIEKENGIIDSMIFPGQELLVPVWEVK